MSDATDDTKPPPALGETIGSYRLLGKLGEGGVGVVYEARHTRLSRRAAVKVLRPEFSANPDMVRRFFNEAESVNLVQHPGIVNIFEFGQLPDKTAFIVMEYLDGETLRVRLRRQGRLGLGGLRLMRQVASALAAAHGRGIVHRDLKPENIMIVRDPDVPGGERTKLLDFGIAKITATAAETGVDSFRTQAGQVMGTPAYMSPEQLRDTARVNDRTDVYALGVLLYEVLCGRLPFTGSSMAELVGMHLFSTPRPLQESDPELPAELCRVVETMLAKEPADRPAMAEVLAALERLDQPQAPVPTRRPAPGAAGRRLWPLGLLGGAVLAGGLGAALYRGAIRPVPAPVPAPVPPKVAPAPPAPVDLAVLREQSLAVLREGLRAPEAGLRRRAADLLGQSRDARNSALLLPLLGDPEPAVQARAAAALRQLGDRAAAPALRALLAARGLPEEVRLEAAGALHGLGDRAGERHLEKALRAREEALRLRAAVLLGERGHRRAREQLLDQELREEDHAAALGRLARLGDREAREALRRALPRQGAPGELGLRVAEELARDEDAEARALLETLARGDGPLAMRAARLLAGLDDPAFQDRFIRCFPDERCPLPDRILSAEGLGAYGRRESAPLLGSALPAEARRALRLRLAAASALLQIALRDPELLTVASLHAVQQDLKDPGRPNRDQAAEALGDAEPRLAVPLLREAIQDREPEVRRSAAHALGRTRVREAVPVLGAALEDSAGSVRREAMASMGRVGEHLRQRGEPVDEVLRTVAGHVGRGDDAEQLAGVAALVRLGAADRREELRRWLRSGDAEIRRQAVAAWAADPSADPEVLVGAIGDRSFGVRFAAAVALGERGRREGVPVLVQALGTSSADAVVARGLLRRLGLATPGEIVLGSGPPSERAAMVSAAAYLPTTEALALLRQAASDVAERVRLRVVAVLGDLPHLARSPLGRRILSTLLADQDALVRSRAGLLVGRLGLRPEDRPAPPVEEPAPAAPDLAAPDQSGEQAAEQPGEQRERKGYLVVEAEPEIRFQVDRRPPQTASAKPLALAPGRHRIGFAGGSLEVEVRAGETTTARVPLTQGQQLLLDGVAAFEAGDLERAQQLLGRAQRLLGRSGAGRGEWYRLLSHQGRIHEAQGRWLDAMNAYEQLAQRIPERERAPEQQAELGQALARVASHLGRIRVSKEVEGRCQTTELWLLPGIHVLDVGDNSREVRVRAGETQVVQACQSKQ